MTFNARVFTVMTASPGDASLERNHVRTEVFEWNDIHARHRNIMLMPLEWENSMAPEMGGEPQEIINKRLLEVPTCWLPSSRRDSAPRPKNTRAEPWRR